jgi:hypothetical protein
LGHVVGMDVFVYLSVFIAADKILIPFVIAPDETTDETVQFNAYVRRTGQTLAADAEIATVLFNHNVCCQHGRTET